MICRSCGREINDGVKFCPYCGMDPAGSAGSGSTWGSVSGTSGYTGPEAPVSGGGKKKGLIIGGVAAILVAAALIVAAAAGLFSNPKAQVEKAAAKSLAAYAAAREKLGMPDVEQWQKDKLLGQQFNLKLTGINSDLTGYDLSALEGLGLYMDADYNLDARVLSFDMGAYWGEDDLLSFFMAAEDDEMYFRSPQFTGETSYGVNTETLGADLTELTGDGSMDGVSFNLFDLMDLALERVDPETMEEELREANRVLWKAAEVKKAGTRTLARNGTETKSALYHVTISQGALERYVDSLETALSALNYYELYEELFRSMGLPEEETEDFLSQLEDLDVYGELADSLREAVGEIGTLELDVCLYDGYVSAVLYEDNIYGTEVELTLDLGGGEEYVDDVGLEVKVNSTEVTVKSTGDHGLKGGTYTDETTVRVRQLGTSVARITSTAHYDPRAEENNFRWGLEANSSGLSLFTLETAGSLTAETRSVALELDDISLRVMGMEVCSLSFDYKIRRGPEEMTFGDARLITEMDMAELTAFANELEANAETWLSDMQALFLARLPAELLMALLSA